MIENQLKKHLNRSCAALNRIHLEFDNLHPDNWTYKVIKRYLDHLMLEKGKSAAYRDCVIIRNFLPSSFKAYGVTPFGKKAIQ